MKQVPWFERQFSNCNTQNTFPSIVERLSGTATLLNQKVKGIPNDLLTRKINNTWSVKENIGHLTDLEPLWLGRLQDILSNHTELREADLHNIQTHQANHNDTHLSTLLFKFKSERRKLLNSLQNLDESALFKSALHPRLKTPMTLLQLLEFVAEHDTHHLSRMTEIISTSPLQIRNSKKNSHYRVLFDFYIQFTNGGSLEGTDFRLDIFQKEISNEEVTALLVKDLRLLMVGDVKIENKRILLETHKRK
ncbi:DinB family protein [Flavobacterium sedimenticola]|uniref:DinB family protein n=1 Tax=Flavobacterium sedimenticola TaxID=3043286 RepID=A0ABT6XP53_9FLAO|nr:DinB family protein [Flavobacterium sedimenticola]MDI9256803.1 DinB family protein [Flavobacterium sedimenticola]